MDKAKHAFGSSSKIQSALENNLINERDVLFLDEDTDNPKIGWVTKDGKAVIVNNEKADLTELEAEIAKKAGIEEVEAGLATKANAKEVKEEIEALSIGAKTYTDEKIEAAIAEHMAKKYAITNKPKGTIVDFFDKEIRVLCPVDTVWTKQNVGEGGDENTYYMTFKTYAPSDAAGYIEHLGDQVDSEILSTFSTDKYGRRYQPTWLALAKYDETTDTWIYYGKNSSVNKYIGWDYQIDWYDTDGVMIASDSIRINLSNEECHSGIKPYYIGEISKEIDEKIEEKITEIKTGYEIIEF